MIKDSKTNLEEVAVVILNYNGKTFLETFLPSVINNSGNAKIIVADNNSTDNSILYLEENYPKLKIINLKNNYGFCGGYNRTLSQIKAKYYVLLNSDVEVTANWLNPLFEILENNQNIAACQPKIKSYHERDKFEYAGAAGGFIDFLGYPFARGRVFDSLETDQNQYNDEIEIFWATGACMFIRAELYHKFKGFNELFFAHMEEIDLCWRLKNVGYKIYYTGKSQVYHIGGGTLNRTNPRKTFYNFRNGLILLFNNLSNKKLIPIVFVRLILDGLAGIKFLLSGEIKNLFAIFKAHISFYYHIPKLWKHRKFAQKNVFKHCSLYNNSIVLQYYYYKKKDYKSLD